MGRLELGRNFASYSTKGNSSYKKKNHPSKAPLLKLSSKCTPNFNCKVLEVIINQDYSTQQGSHSDSMEKLKALQTSKS